ncbi:MAG: ABC transporter ATP-binding protein [Elusimicrobiota bacterium]
MEDYELQDIDKKEKIDYKSALKLVYNLSVPYRKSLGVAFLYLLLSTGTSLLIPILAKYAIDEAIKTKNFKYLIIIMSAYLANSLLFLSLNYISSMRLIKTGQDLILGLKKKLYEHLLSLDTDYYSRTPVGKIMARVQSDSSALYELFTQTVVSIFKDILMFMAIFAIMFYYNAELAKILLPVVIFIVVIVKIFIDKSSSVFVSVRKLISEISGFLSERLNSVATIQSFNKAAQEEDSLNNLNRKKFDMALKAEFYSIIFFMTLIMFDPISKALIFGYGGSRVLSGSLSVGALVMFVLYVGQLFEPIFMFSEHISIIQKSFSAGHRINSLLALRPKIINSENPVYLDSFKKGIRFEKVFMKYEQASDWIIKDLTFEIPKGKTIAVVGKTGGGKTTLTNLLLRFNDYQKGEIYIDGIELKKVNIKSIRKLIGLVQQDIYLFPGTVAENLKLMDKSVDESRLEYAVKTLELEYFYRKHPLNKKITEKGNNLSQGEKQIIALTRSMVLDQEILCLDEATSNIDPYTERMLTRAIKNVMKHKTMMIIAHRLSTIESADTIIFLNNGEIAELGSHDELLAKKGHYFRYYSLQTGI